jgi:hypothetical protein
MKKLIVVLVIALLPTLAFAVDFQIGGTAMYKGMLADITSGTPDITFDDFTFGGEARLTFGLIQGAATVLYFPAEPYDSLMGLLDAGITLNLAIIRLGAGLGLNYGVLLDGGAVDGNNLGVNAKVAVDLQLGKLSLGVVGYYLVPKFSDFSVGFFKTAEPWLGLTLLYKLF